MGDVPVDQPFQPLEIDFSRCKERGQHDRPDPVGYDPHFHAISSHVISGKRIYCSSPLSAREKIGFCKLSVSSTFKGAMRATKLQKCTCVVQKEANHPSIRRFVKLIMIHFTGAGEKTRFCLSQPCRLQGANPSVPKMMYFRLDNHRFSYMVFRWPGRVL